MPIHLTAYHLRFTVEAETTIEMGEYKGSALRGAWQSHLRTLYCAQRTDASPDPVHQALCPVCYLLSREAFPGDDRRPYAFQPPRGAQRRFASGDSFHFGISIFGQAIQFLPYIVLAVQQMGQVQGLGYRIHPQGRRGTFRLQRIDEINPLTGAAGEIFRAEEPLVQMPRRPVTPDLVARCAGELAGRLAAEGNALTLEFLTPLRLTQQKQLVHQPKFVPFLARLIDRLSALQAQFAAADPISYEEKGTLLELAAGVELADDRTEWWDIKGRSTRLGRIQPLGGLVGRATYRADDWGRLLPWLLWGASIQVGKNIVKGCGWYRIVGLPHEGGEEKRSDGK